MDFYDSSVFALNVPWGPYVLSNVRISVNSNSVSYSIDGHRLNDSYGKMSRDPFVS